MRPGRRILRTTLIAYASHGVSVAVALLLVPFLIQSLGIARYGVIGVVQSVLLLATLLDLGMRPAALRQISHWISAGQRERASLVASTALTLYLSIGMLLLSLLLLGGRGLLSLLRIPVELALESYAVLVTA